ncbi:MAG: S1C family serine protease [Oscillospiraceae bacterium]|nr:S1C family serine protease [Oscillospiraceae bacterium]
MNSDQNNGFEYEGGFSPDDIRGGANAGGQVSPDAGQQPFSGSFLSELRDTENDLPGAAQDEADTMPLPGGLPFSESGAETGQGAENVLNAVQSEGAPQSVPRKKRKKLGMKGFVALICVLCAVIGGVSGGLSVAVYDRVRLNPLEQGASGTTDENEESATREEETLAGHTEQLPTLPEEATTPPVSTPNTLTAKEIYANSVDSVVGITGNVTINNGIWGSSNARIAGSGFIISKNGYIVTNAHVVTDVKDLTVTLFNNESYTATLVGSEKSNDIAVIKIDAPDLQSAEWGSSGDLSVGDDLIVIGNPLGELTHTLTTGVVSALSRQIESDEDIINMFQTNAAINSGNSGGPVFNTNGEVVGIATSKYASESIEGLSFCIPSDDIKGYIDDIIAYGYAKNRPLLGVSVQTVTSSIASRYKLVLGAYVVELGSGNAAAKAGIQKGDVIVELNNQSISSVADLQGVLHGLKAKETVPVIVYRNGQRVTLSIALDEKKPAGARTNYTNVYDL